MTHHPLEVVVIGCSAGGIEALHTLLPALPPDFPLPVVVVIHLSSGAPTLLPQVLQTGCTLPVIEAEERQPLRPGCIHVAAPDYHLLIEPDHTFALSADAKVNNSRPAIDLTFISAAEVWGAGVLAILLTGASADGARGMQAVKARGGICIVQDPATAQAPAMPAAAIATGVADHIAKLDEITGIVVSLCCISDR
ncbi:putative chemotaxis protein-glutamate methylesterase [Candidatus Terasakiella magnetica]|nr:putative chemotaxis protein-glutamate methylesterase [Candidatus Terasakiella magnetica]